MKTYILTAFEANGEKILDEAIKAKDDSEAKKLGQQLIEEKNLTEKTHRLISPDGRLLLFQS